MNSGKFGITHHPFTVDYVGYYDELIREGVANRDYFLEQGRENSGFH